jgi:prephenate dehydrogenase
MSPTELPVIQPGQPGRPDRSKGSPPIFDKVGIVGLGLIGGSIALAARQLWPSSLVIAVDNKDVLETAMRLHAIDVAADDLIVLAEADLVVLAAPVRQNLSILAQLDEHVRTPAVVTDVGSTKRVMTEAARGLPDRFTFVGGHPLAGSAHSGLEYAREDLFRGRPWILTTDGAAQPTRTAEAATTKLTTFVQALGAVPKTMTAEAHDRLVAALSHLPQLAASALMQVVGDRVGTEGLSLAGRGLADTTRLAASPAEIWKDIAATNPDNIGAALDAFIAVLKDLRKDLNAGNRLDEVFDAAARWRRDLDGMRNQE